MGFRSGNQEIGVGLALGNELRPDAAGNRLKRPLNHARPVAGDRGPEMGAAVIGQPVVHPVDPFDIGTEAAPAVKIQRQVDPEPARFRHRIDEVPKRRPAVDAVIGAARKARFGNRPAGLSSDGPAEHRRLKPRRIDEALT
eukprot:gene3745-5114_t